jgi:hypothetical protein
LQAGHSKQQSTRDKGFELSNQGTSQIGIDDEDSCFNISQLRSFCEVGGCHQDFKFIYDYALRVEGGVFRSAQG